jgi:hypothetical protein
LSELFFISASKEKLDDKSVNGERSDNGRDQYS